MNWGNVFFRPEKGLLLGNDMFLGNSPFSDGCFEFVSAVYIGKVGITYINLA